jgi:large subunit ribosomal protein L35
MPKIKSKRGAHKRFNSLGGGAVKRTQANLRHILTKKATKRKRKLRGTVMLDASNAKSVRAMLPYN